MLNSRLKGEVGPDGKRGAVRSFEGGALYGLRWVPARLQHGCLLFKEGPAVRK